LIIHSSVLLSGGGGDTLTASFSNLLVAKPITQGVFVRVHHSLSVSIMKKLFPAGIGAVLVLVMGVVLFSLFTSQGSLATGKSQLAAVSEASPTPTPTNSSSKAESAYRKFIIDIKAANEALTRGKITRDTALANLKAQMTEIETKAKNTRDAALASAKDSYNSEVEQSQSDGEKKSALRTYQAAQKEAQETYKETVTRAKTDITAKSVTIETVWKQVQNSEKNRLTAIKKQIDTAYSVYKQTVKEAEMNMKDAINTAKSFFDRKKGDAANVFIQKIGQIRSPGATPPTDSGTYMNDSVGNSLPAEKIPPCAEGETLINGRCK